MSPAAGRAPRSHRLRQLAQLGFWFFLIKGLLWLTLPMALAWWASRDAL